MVISLLIIAMSLAAISGGTLAWFTGMAEVGNNTFTAGTVEISAENSEAGGDPIVLTNWNPGDSDDYKFTFTNSGTKAIYIRAKFDGSWGEAVYSIDGETPPDLNNTEVVTVGVTGTWSEEIEGWYYFVGSVTSSSTGDLDFTVTLDGPNTTNWYQGATYTLTVTFEAIQSSHEAVMEQAGWGVGFVDGAWHEVNWNAGEERWEANGKYWDGEFWIAIP
jgi:predicted ribosomally synthesized peptide with SipW-like signal peptide